MRDLVVREALRAMAREAAKRFRELVAAGEDIPYDVREPGNGSPLPQYVPLTERFVRDHAPALAQLDAYGAACAALESADLAGPYLEEFGIPVPPDPRKRAELAGIVFLCRLWHDSTDFSLDRERLEATIAELEIGGEAGDDEIEVIVPLRGFQMPVARLDLATAIIVRADTVDVPPEARLAEGSGTAGWEPTFLAAARIGAASPREGEEVPDAGARAVEAFRQLITALRLFKPGGVALGPHAWTRGRADRWRRIATGAGRPRPGGYWLADGELGELAAFSRALAFRSTAFGRPARDGRGSAAVLARAISRFEAGLERGLVLDALNDYLLALRFLLEGGGPADLGLPMRVAALCAEPERRGETKAIMDRALALERELWSGEPAPAQDGLPTPAEIAALIEDLARAILKDAACGHLGADLRATADEILLADGLAVGEGAADQRGGPAEWDEPDQELDDEKLDELEEEEELEELDDEEELDELDEEGLDGPEDDELEPATLGEPAAGDAARYAGQMTLEVRASRRRMMVEPDPQPQEGDSMRNGNRLQEHLVAARGAVEANDRLAELLEERPADRSKTADRVAYLFPRPETVEWNVRELNYERGRRAELKVS